MDVKYIKKILSKFYDNIDDIYEDIYDFYSDYDTLIRDELSDGNVYINQVRQIITDLDAINDGIEDLTDNIEDNDYFVENIERIFDLFNNIKDQINDLKGNIENEVKNNEFEDSLDGERVFDDIKTIRKDFLQVYTNFNEYYTEGEFQI